MNNKSLYYTALERLNSSISGSNEFEDICRKIIKFMFPEYHFLTSEGGCGTQDGGYDGQDKVNKAKLACSIEKNFNSKIKSEIEKSIKNKDSQIFYLSNQFISPDNKKKIKDNFNYSGIELSIYGIDCLSEELEKYFKYNNDPYLYDLLKLSSLIFGEHYNKGYIKTLDVTFSGNVYKKQILDINKYLYYNKYFDTDRIISENPLFDIITKWCSERNFDSLGNITLCGIGYLGKSFLMKMAFNNLIGFFKVEQSKLNFMPLIKFETLKYYRYGNIKEKIKNNIDPLLFFLDGFDELNEIFKLDLDREIQSILSDNNRVRFIISGRNSSFSCLELYSNSIQLYLEKYLDENDIEISGLLNKYKGTSIEELIAIPVFRSFLIKNNISKYIKLDEFYSSLIKYNLIKDKERDDYSKNISKRMTSDINIDEIINALSEFCYKLFIYSNKYIFSENELKDHFTDDKLFLFILDSSIIDYKDSDNISFISNIYSEYFISNALLTKARNIIYQFFFIRNRIKVCLIDTLILFLNCTKYKSKKLYNYIMHKICNDYIAYILLCEFDSIPEAERFKYFIRIFKKYKKDKFWIYYGRFNQPYNPLKNIHNMAQRLQYLLIDKYKIKALNFLKNEIDIYLKMPAKNETISFGNAIILLIPYTNNVWSQNEANILKELSIPLIKYFLYDKTSKELDSILSEKFIFDWYEEFNWTIGWKQKDWELFYYEICGRTCNLFSDISDMEEFTIKFHIFSIFYNDTLVKSLFSPILRYSMKTIYLDNNHMASFVSNELTDEDVLPVVKTDDRAFTISYLLNIVDIEIKEVIDILAFAVVNNLYESVRESFDNPIKILEEKLYNNIENIEKNDYQSFSTYFLNIEDNVFDNRLFKINKHDKLDNLKGFLIEEIIKNNINKYGISNLIQKLLNMYDPDKAIDYLNFIKENISYNIYSDTIYYIYFNNDHILKRFEFVTIEYNSIFYDEIKKTIERNKRIKELKEQIDLTKNEDITLMLDNNKMIDELIRINNYIINVVSIINRENNLHKLYELKHQALLNIVSYKDLDYKTNVFSECALKIIEDYYRDNILDINNIIEHLQSNLFEQKYFYIYYFKYYISNMKLQKAENEDIIDIINNNEQIRNKIIYSINIDVYEKFKNLTMEDFQYVSRIWLIPFLYYYQHFFNKIPPEWMKIEHILKLIVTPNPGKMTYMSHDKNLSWFTDIFDIISPDQIIDYGLKAINNVEYGLSRIQIVEYFINYYYISENINLKERILEFIINITKLLFTVVTDNSEKYAEYNNIGLFWRDCKDNYIEKIFTSFTSEIIISSINKNRKSESCKMFLLYCVRISDVKQRIKMIQEIETNMKNKEFSKEEYYEIHAFLASLGREESIKMIIQFYIKGKPIKNRFSFSEYPIGYLKANNDLLNCFIDLLFYSTAKSTERRNILQKIAQEGIRQHLNIKNFKCFEKRILKEVIKLKNKANWLSEYYHNYLLDMEQYVFIEKSRLSKNT